MQKYHSFREELGIAEGIIFKGHRIIIPNSMRKPVIHDIHRSHKSLKSCLQLAREYVYWPNMNLDIEQFCRKCPACQRFHSDKTKETIMMEESPERPWMYLCGK
uniref:RNA-directed DNA polymerase n=1 Tax=Lygus hesperus TaxID=30085 RepID=A0A0A9Y6G8_LYGHE